MKRIIQLALLCIVIISIFIFIKIYFLKNKKTIIDLDIPTNQLTQQTEQTENSIITNLKYDVKLKQDSFYTIVSGLSEVTYVDNFELVNMQEVIAKFTDKNNLTLTITSDEALYNNSSYYTEFRKNVEIEYMNNKIFSDKVDINFQDNTVRIFGNVKYDGIQGKINSDNIMIDLITKKVDIYMDNDHDNVQISKN